MSEVSNNTTTTDKSRVLTSIGHHLPRGVCQCASASTSSCHKHKVRLAESLGSGGRT